jgi:steroid delta-isomerase-like uncharacterized protein
VGNESLIQQWFDAGDAGDVDAFDRYLWPDVVVHAPMGLATQGIDAEREVWRSVLAGVPDLRHEVKEAVVDGNTIAARVIVTGTHLGEFVGLPASGRRFEIDQTTFAHIRDGKMAEVREVADTASLLKQLGAID